MAGLLNGKIVLVTGAASGIGRATSLVLAKQGAQVVVSDMNKAGGEETVGLIKQEGGEARFIAADITSKDQVEALVDASVKAYGRLDGAYNNAGFGGNFADTVNQTDDHFDKTIAINLKGVWLCMRAELRQMKKQGGKAAIVNTASAAGLVGLPMISAYVAAKHGVVGLTKSAALEFAKSGIRVNAVCPGAIDTPMLNGALAEIDQASRDAFMANQPVGRVGAPREIGDAVAWLLSDAASFVTGVAMPVDGGWVAH